VALGMSVSPVANAAEAATAGAKNAPVETATPSSAALMRKAYVALIKDSIVPAQPRMIATAALEAIAVFGPQRALPLPRTFGADPERDAAWLAERVADLPPSWSVMEAMARAADTAHVAFGTPQRREGIAALGRGQPLSAPGFNFYPLADGRLVLFDVIEGASAHRSGLRAGDVLLRVNGQRAVAADVFWLTALPAGTDVMLAIERASRPETFTLQLIQAEVSPVESRLDDGVGYIFVRWFSRSNDPTRDTAALVRRAVTEFAAKRASGLILDLRSSLGGVGEVQIVSALCDADVIYFVQKPLSAPAQPVKRQGERSWPDRPIVVLINQHTVSAPEALALALRELAHAKIIGQTSRGGLTEFSVVPLADGYGMTIPTGAVRGPMTGVTPRDYAIKPDLQVANPTIDDLLHGRDRQLEAARAALLPTPSEPVR
jgi:carboxyl-terminal processing protease